MKIFNNLNIPKRYKRSSLAIGNFDGVHKGHQKVFKYAKNFAKKNKSRFGILTFSPLPVMFFNKKIKNYRLASENEKFQLLNKYGVDFIINIKGDSPNLNPKIIAQLDNLMRKTNSEIGTLAAKIIDDKEIADPNIVKVKTSKPLNYNNFVRSENFFRTNEIKNISNIYHHIGLYSFTHSALNGYINLSRSENEKIRSLEQMRLLDNNININCGLASSLPLSVDAPNELEKIRKIMEYK